MFVSINHKTFSKNMAQGPRPAKAHLRSAERAQTSQSSYFQKSDGPLSFFGLQSMNATAASAHYGNSQAFQ